MARRRRAEKGGFTRRRCAGKGWFYAAKARQNRGVRGEGAPEKGCTRRRRAKKRGVSGEGAPKKGVYAAKARQKRVNAAKARQKRGYAAKARQKRGVRDEGAPKKGSTQRRRAKIVGRAENGGSRAEGVPKTRVIAQKAR